MARQRHGRAVFAVAVVAGMVAVDFPSHAVVFQQTAPDTGNHVPLLLADANESDTAAMVAEIAGGEAECGALPAEYRADCLGQAFTRAAAVQRRGDYRSANAYLSTGGRELRLLARQNADPSAPVVSQNGRRYRAVRKEVVAEVNRKATAIVVETQTKLLRSATGRKRTHYQRIAQAVGSTKRIFRS